MRLIGIGLMAFLLAGIALFLSNSEALRMSARALSEVTLGPRLVFETAAQPQSTRARAAVIYRAGPSSPLILSGLPAYQSAAFFLPIDARPISGHLQIDATVQALAGVEGVLRVSIGNTKRAELLLRPGEAGRSLRIQLTERDIAREQLVVSFSLQGEGPHAPCAIDEGIEAIVEIEATSAIHLELDQPMKSLRDHALAQGRKAIVSWSDGSQTEALLAARQLLRSGIDPKFDRPGMSPSQAKEVANTFGSFDVRPQFAWSDALSLDGSLFGARRFHHTHTWRLRYDMSHGQQARLPNNLDLKMALGSQRLSADWHVVVTLNGKLLFDGFKSPGALSLSLPLAAHKHRRDNIVEITLASTQETPGRCNRGPELVAELLETTAMNPAQASFDDPLLAVARALKNGWQLKGAGLSPAEGKRAAQILSALPEPDQNKPTPIVLRVLPRGTELAALRKHAGQTFLVSFDDADALEAVPVAAHSRRMTSKVAIFVDLAGANS